MRPWFCCSCFCLPSSRIVLLNWAQFFFSTMPNSLNNRQARLTIIAFVRHCVDFFVIQSPFEGRVRFLFIGQNQRNATHRNFFMPCDCLRDALASYASPKTTFLNSAFSLNVSAAELAPALYPHVLKRLLFTGCLYFLFCLRFARLPVRTVFPAELSSRRRSLSLRPEQYLASCV